MSPPQDDKDELQDRKNSRITVEDLEVHATHLPLGKMLSGCPSKEHKIDCDDLWERYYSHSNHDTSLADMMYTRSEISLHGTSFDPEIFEEPENYNNFAEENYKKFTSWFGIRFSGLQTELKFMHEHALLNKNTVYVGYLFQLLATLGKTLFNSIMKRTGLRLSICGSETSKLADTCRDMLGGEVLHGYENVFIAIAFLGITFLGVLLQWLIHRSKRIPNKAWATLGIWIIYAAHLVGIVLHISLFDPDDSFWSLKLFVSYTAVFLIAVWFTGLTFWQSLLLFFFTGSIYFGLSIPWALESLNASKERLAELDAEDDAVTQSTIMDYTTYVTTAPSMVCFCVIVLASAYMNERTSRMRFLQRLIITHQQNNVINEKTRCERLQRAFLENVLPPSIVDKLQGDAFSMGSIERLSQKHQGVSILFADIAGFTSFSTQVDSATVMSFLNELFLHFDKLCDQHHVYKVETVGDCYVAAVGVVTGQIITGEEVDEDQQQVSNLYKNMPSNAKTNTKDMLSFGKAMIYASRLVTKPKLREPALMRVGIHTGPCMSGIVGTRNLRYCLFGDTMNTAARMEQTGMVDSIHATRVVANLTPNESWEARGTVPVKGKGSMETFLLRIDDGET